MKHSQAVDMTNVMQGVEFEGIYNRDSTKYIDFYKIPEVETLLRGTLRYRVSESCGALYRYTCHDLGLLCYNKRHTINGPDHLSTTSKPPANFISDHLG